MLVPGSQVEVELGVRHDAAELHFGKGAEYVVDEGAPESSAIPVSALDQRSEHGEAEADQKRGRKQELEDRPQSVVDQDGPGVLELVPDGLQVTHGIDSLNPSENVHNVHV